MIRPPSCPENRVRFTKADVFKKVSTWIVQLQSAPEPPHEGTDWTGLAEVSYWIGHLDLSCDLRRAVASTDATDAARTLPLRSLGDVVLGLATQLGPNGAQELGPIIDEGLERFRTETHTFHLEEIASDDCLRAHFIVGLGSLLGEDTDGEGGQQQRNPLHEAALKRVELLRTLSPFWLAYGCQGYGHNPGSLPGANDDTLKTGIPRDSMHPRWAVSLNSVAGNLAIWPDRPSGWADYAASLAEQREAVIEGLGQLRKALIAHFEGRRTRVAILNRLPPDEWADYTRRIRDEPALPQVAVDEWGFTGEGQDRQFDGHDSRRRPTSAAAGPMLLGYSSAESRPMREYQRSIHNFFSQARDVFVAGSALGRAKTEVERALIKDALKKDNFDFGRSGLLSLHNLTEARLSLVTYQGLFRRRFASMVPESVIRRVNNQETKTLGSVWALWQQFIRDPSVTWPHSPDVIAQANVDRAWKGALSKVQKALADGSSSEKRASVIKRSPNWEGRSALWIRLDVTHPADLFEILIDVVGRLQVLLSGPHFVEDPMLSLFAGRFVFVPIVRGHLASTSAWQVPSLLLRSETPIVGDPERAWVFAPTEVDPDAWAESGLDLEPPKNHPAAMELSLTIGHIQLRVAHLSDLTRGPEDVDDGGIDLIKDHITLVEGELNHQLQSAYDLVERLLKEVSEEQSIDSDSREEALEVLSEIGGLLSPPADAGGRTQIELGSSEPWLGQLHSASLYAWLLVMILGAPPREDIRSEHAGEDPD